MAQITPADWAQIVAAIGTMIAAIVAVVAAFQSYRSSKQNNDTNEQMIRPRIVVYVDNSQANISFVDLVVYNEGGGLARDIKFKIKGDDPPVSFSNGKNSCLSDFEVIKDGIKVLPTKSSRRYFVLSTVGQIDEILALKCRIEVSYANSSHDKIYKDSFELDFISLPKMKFANKELSNQKKIVSEIEKIRKALERKK